MNEGPVAYADVESCVDATIARVGRRILLGTPLGLGKANHLVNEFFRRACDYPELEYVEPLRRGTLPPNIRVSEFFFQPGSFLDSPLAQRQYVSSNYTHAVRDVLDAGINVLAQLVAKTEQDGDTRLSLSCNPDLTTQSAVTRLNITMRPVAGSPPTTSTRPSFSLIASYLWRRIPSDPAASSNRPVCGLKISALAYTL